MSRMDRASFERAPSAKSSPKRSATPDHDASSTNARLSAIESKLASLSSMEAKLDAVMGMMRKSDKTSKSSLSPGAVTYSSVKSTSATAPIPKCEYDDSVPSGKKKEFAKLWVPHTVLVESDAGMINPKNKFRIYWDVGVVMPLLVYLAIMMPFRLTFANEARQFSLLYWFEFIIDLLFIIDIFMNFRTGYFIDEDGGSEESQLVEFDRALVAKNYLKTWFCIDVISGIPFALMELVMSNGISSNALKAMKALKLLRFLKLGRLLKMEKIFSNLDQDTLDMIEDFFQDSATRSAVMIMKLLFYLAYTAHLLACGFVFVGKAGDRAGVDTWLNHEMKGPFTSEDTTGANGNGPVYSIYIAGFYFSLTTMTSVGYGDIITHNNLERLYAIGMEFLGAIIFGTVIAEITNVANSSDINARKTAKELDAVSSFVAMRQFPTPLARKIRRHFRQFYSRKSAIDESKIFSELSTSLRAQVSEYLVKDTLGEHSFFQNLHRRLWPKLLSLLYPFNFESGEVVCERGEEATDMYMVTLGTFEGRLTVGDVERVRHITTGDSVNTLHVLGVWHRCVETVQAMSAGETYAVCEQDFMSIFTSEMDMAALEEARQCEVRKFKMEPSREAPLWGIPLYYSRFTCVEFSLLQATGPFFAAGEKSVRLSFGGEELAWVVADLVDTATGLPFNEFWVHTSPKAPPTRNGGGGGGGGTTGGAAELTFNEGGNGVVRWTDVSVPFVGAALRMRLFVNEAVVGEGVVSLQEIREKAAAAASSDAGATATSDASDKEGELDTWFPLTKSTLLDSDGAGDAEGKDPWLPHKLHIRVTVSPPEKPAAQLPLDGSSPLNAKRRKSEAKGRKSPQTPEIV